MHDTHAIMTASELSADGSEKPQRLRVTEIVWVSSLPLVMAVAVD